MQNKDLQKAFDLILSLLRAEPVKDELLVPTLFFLTKSYEGIQIPFQDLVLFQDKSPKQVIWDSLNALNNTYLFRGDFSILLASFPAISEYFFQQACEILYYSFSKNETISGKAFIEMVIRNGKFYEGFHQTPSFIAKTVAELLKSKFNENSDPISLLDLGAGIAMLPSTIRKNNMHIDWTITAIEIVPTLSAIGKMHLVLEGIESEKLEFHTIDALEYFENWRSYDVVISDVPFGSHPRQPFSKSGYNYDNSRVENLFILKAIEFLNNVGIGIFIVPDHLLYSREPSSMRLRKKLIESDLIEQVISLPVSLSQLNGVKSSILVINKDKENSLLDKVLFKRIYDATNRKDKEEENYLSEEILIHTYNIYNSENYLRTEHYLFQSKHNDENFLPLNEVAEVFQVLNIRDAGLAEKSIVNHFDNVKENDTLPYISFRHLANEEGNFLIDASQFDRFIQIPSHINAGKLLKKGDILLATIGKNLKPTLYNLDRPAISQSNIVVVRPNTKIVLPEFLISQLRSNTSKEFADAYRTYLNGTGKLITSDIKKIPIYKLSIKEQNKFVKQFLSETLLESETEHQLSLQQEVHEITKRLRHTLGNSLQILKTDLESLVHFFHSEGYNPITKPTSRAEVAEKSHLYNVLERMLDETHHAERSIQFAQDWSKVSQGLVEKKLASLNNLFKTETEREIWTKYCNIEITGPDVQFSFDQDLMQILLRNFLDNAIRHGEFIKRPKEENIIQIEISTNEDVSNSLDETETINSPTALKIVIRNNGTPFHEGFDTSYFVTDGESTNGTGFGGALIKQIVKLHNGTVSIVPTEITKLSPFKVQFNIELPLSL